MRMRKKGRTFWCGRGWMEYYCEVCDIYTNTFHELQTHFGGSKHNKNLTKIGYSTAFKPHHEVRDPVFAFLLVVQLVATYIHMH